MTEQGLLDFAGDDTAAGFRLQALEIYNWGTFHKKVWRLALDSQNGLLTGDIGSGKSTLVDAVTTLLVPAHRVAYNKAAGADKKERSLRSYVQGYYKSERTDMGHTAKSVALRDHNHYSVILGVFKNQGYVQDVTLAQVFWINEAKGQPERFYVVADRVLSIQSDFSDFGPDINQLKKRLKKESNVEIHNTFPQYGASFRRRFGIEHKQALDLFHQTVSMKSVGNLTDFVREHMLEPFDVDPRITALIHHFDDLSRAHDAVLKAKAQIQRLTPLVEDLHSLEANLKKRAHLVDCRETLAPFFASLKKDLFQKRLKNLVDDQTRLDWKIKTLETLQLEQKGKRDDLRTAIAQSGGDRLARIRSEIERLGIEKKKRQGQAERYAALGRGLALKPVETLEDFQDNAGQIKERQKILEQEAAGLQNQRMDVEFEFRKIKARHEDLNQELNSLAKRKSNIHGRQIRIRDDLCAHLGLDEKDLPFAGELIQVREKERLWEGAAERLLHNFGLSLLVPEIIYKDVAAWVNTTHLRGRLVYYLVQQQNRQANFHLHPDSLVNKLSIKPDTPFYPWLEKELAQRFDYACCKDIQNFYREPMAVTETGQIKSGGRRHEKGDRRDINDRSSFILGWTNEAKIRALEKQRTTLEKQMQELAIAISDLDRQKAKLDATDQNLEETRASRSRTEEKINITEQGIQACENEMASVEHMESEPRDALFSELESMRQTLLARHTLTIESCSGKEQELRKKIQDKIDSRDKRISTLKDRIVTAMSRYRNDYPLETREVDDHISSGPEYEAMLNQLKRDDLPRFEKKFKELLNENTIREVASFQSQLLRERQTIHERIEKINQSLSDIEYNPGRYILLEPLFDSRRFTKFEMPCQ